MTSVSERYFHQLNDELFCYSYYHVMVLMTFYAYVIKLLFIVLFGVLRFLSVKRIFFFLDHVVLYGHKTVLEFIAVTISYNYCCV